jgi:hypothetical protein
MELSRIAFGYFGGAIFAGHSMLYACFFIDCAALRWRFEEEVRFQPQVRCATRAYPSCHL